MERPPCSWIRRLNVVEMILLKLAYRFNAFSVKIPTFYFEEIDMLTLKLIWACKGPRITKTILKKKNRVGRLDFKTFYRATMYKTVWS